MRIIAGDKHGMTLLSPPTYDSRPITDRVKESLFSVLYSYGLLENTTIADLFCGVGSLGLEALSRGATFAVFIERDPKTLAVLNKNIGKAGYVGRSKVIRANAFKVGAVTDADRSACDLVFVDPPYPMSKNAGPDSRLAGLMTLLADQVKPDGMAVVRVQEHTDLPDDYGLFKMLDKRRWGTMLIGLFRNTRQ